MADRAKFANDDDSDTDSEASDVRKTIFARSCTPSATVHKTAVVYRSWGGHLRWETHEGARVAD